MQKADVRTLRDCPCVDANPLKELEDSTARYRARRREERQIEVPAGRPSLRNNPAASATTEI
jgi:hypothetical protein